MSYSYADDRSPRHRRLRRRTDHRDPGLRRRHGRGRGPARHARVGQGDDGRARAGGRRRQGDPRVARRPGLAGLGADDDRGAATRLPRWRRSRRRRLRRRRLSRRRRAADAAATPPPPGAATCPDKRRRSGHGPLGVRSSDGPLGIQPRRNRAWLEYPAATTGPDRGHPVYASPSARRLARELGVELSRGQRQRPQGTDHQGRRAAGGRRRAAAPSAPARGAGVAWPGSAAVADRRLREVRSGRARPALADPADLGAQPGAQLGDDPARHPQRRGRHHRARGVAQAAQRRARAT